MQRNQLTTTLIRMAGSLGLALSMAAQAPMPVPEPAQINPQLQGRPENGYSGSYSESHSRELFRACDTNSDDRLDVLETADAFDALPTAKDHKGFARLDTDRDGFVTWPEFDQRFQTTLKNSGSFRVRTSRQFVSPEPPPQPLTKLQRFLRLHDSDGDGGLSPTEITDLVKRAKLPDSFGLPLLKADLDQSGKIEEAELAPWFQLLPVPELTSPNGPAIGLPQPWLDADQNKDQAIEAPEFAVVLRRLDPGLLRWTKDLLKKLDANSDGKLVTSELQKPAPTNADAKPEPSAGNPQR